MTATDDITPQMVAMAEDVSLRLTPLQCAGCGKRHWSVRLAYVPGMWYANTSEKPKSLLCDKCTFPMHRIDFKP